MPRPAYNAAHSPAGPAPTMITSYPLVACSVIRSEFQSRRISLPRQGARQLHAKPLRLELDIRPPRPGELRLRRRADHLDAVPVAALEVQQRGRRLDQSLPDPRRVGVAVVNNRTPDGFQRLVGEPVLPGVEQIAGAGEGRLALFGRHGRSGGQAVWRSAVATRTDRLTARPPDRPNPQQVQGSVTR